MHPASDKALHPKHSLGPSSSVVSSHLTLIFDLSRVSCAGNRKEGNRTMHRGVAAARKGTAISSRSDKGQPGSSREHLG